MQRGSEMLATAMNCRACRQRSLVENRPRYNRCGGALFSRNRVRAGTVTSPRAKLFRTCIAKYSARRQRGDEVRSCQAKEQAWKERGRGTKFDHKLMTRLQA